MHATRNVRTSPNGIASDADHLFVDRGGCGTSLVERLSLQALVREAETRRHSIIVVPTIDRLFRTPCSLHLFAAVMLSSGIEIHTAESGRWPDGSRGCTSPSG